MRAICQPREICTFGTQHQTGRATRPTNLRGFGIPCQNIQQHTVPAGREAILNPCVSFRDADKEVTLG